MFNGGKRGFPRAGFVAAAMAAALAVTACGSSSSSGGGSGSGSGGGSSSQSSGGSSSQSSGAPIKVAAIASETGAAPFTDWATGAKAYFNAVNAAGGINGHKIDFSINDDAGSPTQAASLARQLVGQGTAAFVASISLDDCAVNRHYYQQEGIASIDIGSDATCFDSPNIAPVNSGPELDPETQMYFASNVLHLKKICVVSYAVPGESADVLGAIKGWEKLSGLKPTLTVLNVNLTGDITPTVIKLKQAGCQAVSVSADLAHGVPFAKAVQAQGIKNMQVIFGTATYSQSFVKSAGSAGNGILMGLETAPYTLPTAAGVDTAGIQTMIKQFKASHIVLDSDSELGYTAAYAFGHVISSMKGPINKTTVLAALRKVQPFSVPTMGTPFTFGTAQAHNPNHAGYFVYLRNGKFVAANKKGWFVLPTSSSAS